MPTADMGETERRDYLKHLKNSEPGLPMAVFATDSGVHLFAEPTRRPCSPVPVRLGHFRVDVKRATSGSAQYSFRYAPIATLTVNVGPQDGMAPDSRPPGAQNCSGTLSVVYVGTDMHGWVEIDALLRAAAAHGFPITRAELDHVVAA
ncbi:hypothetical protein ACWERJ_31665, partial [Streptomyces sp. NPDC004050]